MVGQVDESVVGATSAYKVNDSDFEVSDVEGDMNEEEWKIKRREKIKKKMNERVEKKDQLLFNEKMKLEIEKKNLQGLHTAYECIDLCLFSQMGLFSNVNREGVPPKEVARWRAPPLEHEESHSKPHEVVSFLAFHEQGLGYPAHWFFRGLLHEWGLEFQHLNLNGVLHITGFVTLCEAFLGIEPHVGLFRAFFYGKTSPAKGKTSSATPVGGFGLQRRPRHDDVYPKYTPAESNKGWHGD
ncbi:hypothetical protein C2845_PM09G08710 [Panicum miliaceum]|uniref:Transposase (putative) gypsy type domain-containing protein n=1 Tax=Panicum miliaceum TaxID=4540 RepID=A0A3L6S2G5_PANMI|nr:hypothetical protein C2845_PM09G08710 [Panicum miliaceum]